MEYNTSFTYPTWDKAYIKLLKPFKGTDVHLTVSEIFTIAQYDSLAILKGLVLGHALNRLYEKKGNARTTYALTPYGKELYSKALATKPYVEFIDFMQQYDTYEEFELNCTLSGNLHWCTSEFYESMLQTSLSSPEMKSVFNKLRHCKIYNVWISKVKS